MRLELRDLPTLLLTGVDGTLEPSPIDLRGIVVLLFDLEYIHNYHILFLLLHVLESSSELLCVVELLGGGHAELNHVLGDVESFLSFGRFCHRFIVFSFVYFDQIIGYHIEKTFYIFCVFTVNQHYFVIFDIVVHSHPHRLSALRFDILVPRTSFKGYLNHSLIRVDPHIQVIVLHFDLYF